MFSGAVNLHVLQPTEDRQETLTAAPGSAERGDDGQLMYHHRCPRPCEP